MGSNPLHGGYSKKDTRTPTFYLPAMEGDVATHAEERIRQARDKGSNFGVRCVGLRIHQLTPVPCEKREDPVALIGSHHHEKGGR